MAAAAAAASSAATRRHGRPDAGPHGRFDHLQRPDPKRRRLGPLNLVMSGNGTQVLTGTNVSTQTTTVQGGVLDVAGTGSSASATNVPAGVFRLDGAWSALGAERHTELRRHRPGVRPTGRQRRDRLDGQWRHVLQQHGRQHVLRRNHRAQRWAGGRKRNARPQRHEQLCRRRGDPGRHVGSCGQPGACRRFELDRR